MGTAAKSESVGGGEPRSLIGSEIFIVSVSSVSGALQVASGGGAGQGAGGRRRALRVVLFLFVVLALLGLVPDMLDVSPRPDLGLTGTSACFC